MSLIRAAVFYCLLCAWAVHAYGGEREAVVSHGADFGTTAVGLVMGAAELNPLGVAAVAVKAVAHQHIKALPPSQQPEAWRAWEAFGWGASANNLCVIVVLATGGIAAPACLALGFATGVGQHAANPPSNREIFDSICAEQRIGNPDLICVYNLTDAAK